MIARLLLAGALVAAAAPGAAQTFEPAIASRLLPPETARRVIGGRASRRLFPGQPTTWSFWEAALPEGRALCRRRRHDVTVADAAPSAGAAAPADAQPLAQKRESVDEIGSSRPKDATRESCARVTNFVRDRADTRAALESLTAAIDRASTGGRLPFTLDCRREILPCDDPRRVLAELPMQGLYGAGQGSSAPPNLQVPTVYRPTGS